jgi:hypothetical protein
MTPYISENEKKNFGKNYENWGRCYIFVDIISPIKKYYNEKVNSKSER